MYSLDYDWDGFQWINANDSDRSIFSFIRRSKTGKQNLLFICNFTPVARPDYRVGVPKRVTTPCFWTRPTACTKQAMIR